MDKATWLEQVQEDILAPDQVICDPHHHLWDHPNSRYLIDEICADVGETGKDGQTHQVVSTVFVECGSMYRSAGSPAMAPVGETEFVQGVAAMSESGNYGDTRVASAIVSFADLCLGEAVRPVLEAHIAASPNRFRGIRHAAGWHADKAVRNSHTNPPEHLMTSAAFNDGFAVLDDMNLTFDAWCYHYQIPELVEVAKRFPNTTIILDHFGGPLGIGPFADKKTEVFNEWRGHVEPLVNLPNVYFKLGGINMKVNGFDWHKRALPPTSDELVAATGHYYQHCIENFGAERCMFESNFPVDKESVSYHVLWNAFKKIAANCSAADKQWLFHDTAVKAYGLAARA